MPVYLSKEGIKICVYANDYVPPRVHAIHGEHESLLEITTGAPIKGYLPASRLKKAQAAVAAYRVDLLYLFHQLNPQIREI